MTGSLAAGAMRVPAGRKELWAVPDGDNVMLTLVCVACGAVRAIRIPRERGVPPGRHLWECLDCQAKCVGAGSVGRPWKKRARPKCEAEPKDGEEK